MDIFIFEPNLINANDVADKRRRNRFPFFRLSQGLRHTFGNLPSRDRIRAIVQFYQGEWYYRCNNKIVHVLLK